MNHHPARRTFGRICVAAALLLAWAGSTLAQAFPSRPITLVMPYAAGSNIDIMVRTVATEAGAMLGQPIVLDNKPGALTRLGVEQMRRAAPDGYLLTVATDSLVVTHPVADPEFRFEAGRDFAPVSLIASFPLILVSNPSVPARDVKGLIAYAKSNPGKLNMAGGPGSISHIAFERFNRLTGGNITFIPYKDSSLAISDLITGRVDLVFSGSLAKPLIDAGKLRGLATTGAKHWTVFPQLPTLQEEGVNMTARFWMGLVAPPSTPPEIVAKLNQAFSAALKSETVARKAAEFGMEASPSTPAQFAAFVKSELAAWTPIIQASGIKVR